ncbi:hypothetical protein ACU6ZT_16285 [Klebsiella aerogenes]
MERKFNYNINTINEEQMKDLGLEQKYIEDILHYREVFKLKLNEDKLVKLKKLWEALGCSYGSYSMWKTQLVDQEVLEEISSLTYKPVKGSKGGRPRVVHMITTEGAKALAMLTRSDVGRAVRKYFIAVEKLCNLLITYHDKRVEMHKPSKDVYHVGCKAGGKPKGASNITIFNSIMVELVGKRNAYTTDCDDYRLWAPVVANMMMKGKTSEYIINALK